MSTGVDIRRISAENIRCNGLKIYKSTRCSRHQGLSSSKKSFLLNALMSRYTIYKVDDFEQMESFSKIFFLTLIEI
jgi:hypothetical protein